uniref:NADH dehydrogenase subunit 5 n=1 Tax=Antonbruunia milenae TaxID=3053535 RepID=UPI0030DF2408
MSIKHLLVMYSGLLGGLSVLMAGLSMVLIYNSKMYLVEWVFMSDFGVNISLPFIMDSLGVFYSSVVLLISCSVMFYSEKYMELDIFKVRFSKLVLLFVFSMNLLIFIPHMMCLLIGWDGLGLTSFLLIIYYQNAKSLSAGLFTLLSNRIGDVLILFSIGLTLNQGHWLIPAMWLDGWMGLFLGFLVMLAAMTKSAQTPFSSWLPAAMAAPTPVSALVHSSTLVTAGVFIIIRFYSFLCDIYMFNFCLLMVGSVTMVISGSCALVECDFKKVIALSTLSQLGVMMSSLGLGMPMLAYFHLVTHALFKSLLFLCAGAVISVNNHSQDLRGLGNVFFQTPVICSSVLLANMALCGLPFMAGFYSKDLIIEMSFQGSFNLLIVSFYVLGGVLTALYSLRVMIYVVWGGSLNKSFQQINDEENKFKYPLLGLSLWAVVGGALINWGFITPLIEPILSVNLKWMMTSCVLLTLSLGTVYIYFNKTGIFSMINGFNYMGSSMWFLDMMTTQGLIPWFLHTSHKKAKLIDHGWVELLGPQGVFSGLNFSFNKLYKGSTAKFSVFMSLMTILMILMLIQIL